MERGLGPLTLDFAVERKEGGREGGVTYGRETTDAVAPKTSHPFSVRVAHLGGEGGRGGGRDRR